MIVIGAGGHAKVVISTLQAMGTTVDGILDDDASKYATEILGVPVRGPITGLQEEAVIAIGDNQTRKRIAESQQAPWSTAIHPTVVMDSTAKIESGSVVFAGAILQPNVRLGRQVIVSTAATLDHDCELHDYAQISPGVNLAGNVVVEEGVFLGTGATVIPGIRIGAWAVVGAGAVVTKDIPPGVTVVGNPARIIKEGGT